MLSPQYQQLRHDYVLYSAVLHSQTPQYTVVFYMYSGVIFDIFKTENQFSKCLRGSLCLFLSRNNQSCKYPGDLLYLRNNSLLGKKKKLSRKYIE
jgi:hypothetical protein